MKILIISDSHGNIANLKTAVEIGKKADIKGIIHCGDWDNLETFRAAQSFNIPIYSVLGNADVDSNLEDALRFECKKYDQYFLKLKIDGKRIGVTHRMTKNIESGISNLDIVFYGDTHSKEERMVNWTKFVRPGALINGINFAVYETVTGSVEFINET